MNNKDLINLELKILKPMNNGLGLDIVKTSIGMVTVNVNHIQMYNHDDKSITAGGSPYFLDGYFWHKLMTHIGYEV